MLALNQSLRSTALPMILLVLFMILLQGCFHDDDDAPAPVVPPVVNAVPTGYYDVTGTASVSDGMGGILSITDLQAMVNGNDVMMMSTANGLLYDGTITSISGNEFTADFRIYKDGENPISATVSGAITQGSSITGTLTGSGAGSGSFSLSYALSNNQAAAISRIENGPGKVSWQALIGGAIIEQEFVIDNVGVITHDTSSGGGIFTGCDFAGTITPINGSSLYDVTVTLTNCTRDLGVANGTYTGLAASRTGSNPDDTLVFAVTNDLYSPNGDFI